MSHSFHFYDPKSGELHEASCHTNVANPEHAMEFAKLNAPPGHLPIAGHYDARIHRVDLKTGTAYDYEPPAPSADHVWNAAHKRWVLSEAAQAKFDAAAAARQQIAALEAGQHRIVREVLLGKAGAQERLQALHDQIAALEKAVEP